MKARGLERSKQSLINLIRLCKWLAEQTVGNIVMRQILLQTTNDRKMWKVMMAYIFEGHSAQKKKINVQCTGNTICLL